MPNKKALLHQQVAY